MTEAARPITNRFAEPLPLESMESLKARLRAIQERGRAFGKALFPFQVAGVIRAATAPGPVRHFLFADEMGLGKTDQACCVPQEGVPIMIGCPSVQKRQWAATMRLRRPNYRARIIERRVDWRWAMPGEVIIFNYELMPPSWHELMSVVGDLEMSVGAARPSSLRQAPRAEQMTYIDRLCNTALAVEPAKVRRVREIVRMRSICMKTPPHPNTVLIGDEAQRMKNADAKLNRQWREAAATASVWGGNIYLLTATPEENGPDELWNVLECGGLGKVLWGDKGSFDVAVANGTVAESLRKVSIMRRVEDVMPDLPEKRYETIIVPLGDAAKKLADDVVSALKLQGIDIEKAALSAIAHAMAKKIPREMISALRKAIATAKIPFMLELVDDMEAQRQPWLVASLHKAPLETLMRRPHVVRISGAETSNQKSLAMEQFQDKSGPIRGCAISTKSAASGPTLTRAWRMIEVDIPWNPAVLDQLEGRIRRIGQEEKSLLYTRLEADHVLERRVNEKVLEKRESIEKNVNASAIRPGDAGWGWGDFDDEE